MGKFPSASAPPNAPTELTSADRAKLIEAQGLTIGGKFHQRREALIQLCDGASLRAAAIRHRLGDSDLSSTLQRYLASRSLDELRDRPPNKRRYGNVLDQAQLVELLQKNPRDLGFEIERWDIKHLGHHLRAHVGIELTDRTLQDHLRRQGFSCDETTGEWRLPAVASTPGDPQAGAASARLPVIPARFKTQLGRADLQSTALRDPEKILPTRKEYRILHLLRAAHHEMSLSEIDALVSSMQAEEIASCLRSLRDRGFIACRRDPEPPAAQLAERWSVLARGEQAARLLEPLSTRLYDGPQLPPRSLLLMLLVLEQCPQGLLFSQLNWVLQDSLSQPSTYKYAVTQGYLEYYSLEGASRTLSGRTIFKIMPVGQQLLDLMRALSKLAKQPAPAFVVQPNASLRNAQRTEPAAPAQQLDLQQLRTLLSLHAQLPTAEDLRVMRAMAEERDGVALATLHENTGRHAASLAGRLTRLRQLGYVSRRPHSTRTEQDRWVLRALGRQALTILEPVAEVLYLEGERIAEREIIMLLAIERAPQGMSTEDIVRAVLSQLAPSTARLLLQSMTEKHYLQSVLPSPAPDDKPEPLYQLTERAQQLLAALRAFAAALAKASATLAQQRSADVSDQDGRAAQPEIPAQLRTQLDRTLRLALSFGKPQRLLPTIGEFRVLTLLRAAHSEQSLDDIRSSLVSPPVEAELLSNLRSLRDKGLIASSTESRPPIICWSVSERGKPAAELLESLSSVLYTESGLPSKALLLMLLVLEHRPQGLRLVQLQELAERRIINSPALKSAVEKGYIQCDDLQDAPHAVYHISALGQQLLQLMRTLLRIKKEARSAAASPVTPAPRELSAQAAAYLALAQRLRELHKRLPQLAELQSMRWLAGAEERFRAQPQEPGAQSSPEHGLQQHVSRLRAAGYAEKRVVVRPLKTSTVMGLSSLGEQVLAILEPVCAALYPAGELLGMQEMLLLYVLHQTPQGLSGQQVVQALRTQVSADKVPTLLQSMIDTQYLQTVVPEATAGTVPQPSYQLTARAAELLARLQAFESTFPQAPRKPRTAASRRVSREAGVRAR